MGKQVFHSNGAVSGGTVSSYIQNIRLFESGYEFLDGIKKMQSPLLHQYQTHGRYDWFGHRINSIDGRIRYRRFFFTAGISNVTSIEY